MDTLNKIARAFVVYHMTLKAEDLLSASFNSRLVHWGC